MQLTLSTAAFLALVASTAAVDVTSPSRGDEVDLSQDTEITWETVSSDPDTFDIVLTNNNVNPPVEVTVAADVDASEGSFMIPAVDDRDATAGANYRLNLQSDTPGNEGILAQSEQFTVVVPGVSSTPEEEDSESTSTATETVDETTAAETATETFDETTAADASATAADSTIADGETMDMATTTATSDAPAATETDASESDSDSASSSETDSDSDSDPASETSASETDSSDPSAASDGASSLNKFAGAGLLAMVAVLFA